MGSTALKQVTLGFTRSIVVNIARAIHGRFYVMHENGVILPDPSLPLDKQEPLRIAINIVQNAMSPNIFGAIVLIEHYFCSFNGVSGFVDFKVVLLEVNDNPLIVPSQIRIVEIDAKLKENTSTEDILKQIAAEWNK